MDDIKRRFESGSKTRVNLIGPSKCGKSTLALNLVKDGIFDDSQYISGKTDEIGSIFSTEILCTGPRSNEVILYLDLKNKEYLLSSIKENILNNLDKGFSEIMRSCELSTINSERNKQNKFFDIFEKHMKDDYETPLKRFFAKDSLRQVFAHVNFERLFQELNKENNEEILEIHDNIIWNKYFNGFVDDYNDKYSEWINKINKYYDHSKKGYRYVNELDNTTEIFYNDKLKNIIGILYGIDKSCGLMIERAYVEVPGKNNMYSGIVFIDYYSYNFKNDIIKDIENRISMDYKELFIIVEDCNNFTHCAANIKKNLNKITLDKRIFCVLNKFDSYKNNLNINCTSNNENILEKIKEKASDNFKIDKNRIIVTEKFNDIDKYSLEMNNCNNEFLRLLKLIKVESNKIHKSIKIRNPTNVNNIISIKLNQERMSVQALVNMLYEKYNHYLINLWRDIKKGMDEYENDNTKKYCINATRLLIRSRKNDYRGYKYKFNNEFIIDFSMQNGEQNEAKKILKMLLNYGYRTVGFSADENKILIKVNGDISNDDKIKLIDSIKGRLEESAVTYFDKAFLTTVTNKEFTKNNLSLALETEKNITIDDFYLAINEAFKKMSENIVRYDINIQ
ncbi:MAG TPA: hypothetical protein DG753_01405 [Clostridium sp.]|nr:hypothetical protein [Clostridium sp.]